MSKLDLSLRQAEIAKRISEKRLSPEQVEAIERIYTATPEQIERIQAVFDVQEKTDKQVDAVLANSESVESGAKLTEKVEVDTSLTKFAEMYNKWSPVSKSRLSWKRVQTALLANDGALLRQVEAIPKGPIMFGADKNGNILFANGGVEPILTGMSYSAARKVAKAMGLSLFPYAKPNKKSEEILLFEEFTDKPLVSSESKDTWKSTWLEDGDNLGEVDIARVYGCDHTDYYEGNGIGCDPMDYYKGSGIGFDIAFSGVEHRGVRGMLRAQA